jgi:hypothetical protein
MEETTEDVKAADAKSSSTLTGTERDIFAEDWKEAREEGLKRHRIYDYNYLFYRSILTYNEIYGEKYLRSFGLQVFVPRVFQTVQSIYSQLNQRKLEFKVEYENKNEEKKAKMVERFDNIEWKRSGADEEKAILDKDRLIYGEAQALVQYLCEEDTVHVVKEDQKDVKLQDLVWVEKTVKRYEGMVFTAEDPYFIFRDPRAKRQDKRRHVYRYVIMSTADARRYVVDKGYLTEEEADVRVIETPIENFAAVRETIDWLYRYDYNGFNRGDHIDPADVGRPHVNKQQFKQMTAFIERYERDYYEIRLANETKTLYKDFNIYPHKEIPVVTVYDVPLEHEDRGMGEPEIMRWQQIEENKLHNFLLQTLLMAIVNRFAINADLLEDETDLYFYDPFKPIRLKAGVGAKISDAMMPVPLPDVKQSPLELMKIVQETNQKTTGATDQLAGTPDPGVDSATESNNMVAGASARIKDKIREGEKGINRILDLWHACYPVFYEDEREMFLIGEKQRFKYIPEDRSKYDDKRRFINKAAKELNATPNQKTVEDVYKSAGFDGVIYLSDLQGGKFFSNVTMADPDIDDARNISKYGGVIKMMTEVNKAAGEAGDARKFDVFSAAQECFKKTGILEKVDDLVLHAEATQKPALGFTPPPPPGVQPVAAAPAAAPAPEPVPQPV